MSTFRNYNDANTESISRVVQNYAENHTKQTFQFATAQKQHLKSAADAKDSSITCSIWDILHELDDIVDQSDPDTDMSQLQHALQTAEHIRNDPNLPSDTTADWFPLVGLIHDIGKLLSLPKYGGAPQWAVVGDTFPLGCAFSDKIVYPHFFTQNPDYANPSYNTKYGIYTPNCGFDAVTMSWGHDEYLAQVLGANPKCTLPEEAIYIIRYHSFYAAHQHDAYSHLMNEKDRRLMPYVKQFQKYDLYSKKDKPYTKTEMNQLIPIYQRLMNKYLGGDQISNLIV